MIGFDDAEFLLDELLDVIVDEVDESVDGAACMAQ